MSFHRGCPLNRVRSKNARDDEKRVLGKSDPTDTRCNNNVIIKTSMH